MTQYSKTFEHKARKPYVVAALPRGKFMGFVIKDPSWTDRQIHTAIAKQQNTSSSTHYMDEIKPGSFNFVRVDSATDLDDAIEQAKAQGLVSENIQTVYERNAPLLLKVIQKQGAPQLKGPDSWGEMLGNLFGSKGNPFGDGFKL